MCDPPTGLMSPFFQCPDINTAAEYARLKREIQKKSRLMALNSIPVVKIILVTDAGNEPNKFFPRHTVTRTVLHVFRFQYIATSIYSTKSKKISPTRVLGRPFFRQSKWNILRHRTQCNILLSFVSLVTFSGGSLQRFFYSGHKLESTLKVVHRIEQSTCEWK